MTPEFTPFDKIARLNREIVVTEKIDGTNGQILIEQGGEYPIAGEELDTTILYKRFDGGLWQYLRAGSRNKWLTRTTDNMGFAKWAQENALALFGLGIGRHFGEWWGSGIQRRYGLTGTDKRFSLFNSGRWFDQYTLNPLQRCNPNMEQAPACCRVVPVLGMGTLALVGSCVEALREGGSLAAPGFMDPEGVVVYHTAAKTLFKVTLKNDEKPKGNSGNSS